MKGDGVHDTVTLAVSGILVLASVVGLLRGMQPRRLLSRAWGLLRSATQGLASCGKASTDEVDTLVEAKMQQLRVDHVRWCFRAFCACLTAVGLFGIYFIALGLPRGHSAVQDLMYVLMHFLCVLVVNCPKLLSWRTVDVFIGMFMLCLTAYTSPWFCTADQAVVSIATVTSATILLNTVRRSVFVSAAFNSLMALAVIGTIRAHKETVFMRADVFAVFELMILMLFPAFAYTLDVSISRGIRKSLEMQVAKEVLSAAAALLNSCCDVVVELDQEGTILNPAKDLGGFLLRGPGRCFQGFKLPQLFSLEEDRETFLRKLSAAESSGSGLAEARHVLMKDGNDEQLRVELMWFGFRHLDGAQRFMLGLREFSDFSPKAKGRSRRRRRQPRAEPGEESSQGSPRRDHDEGSDPGLSPRSEASEGEATLESTTSLEVQVASLTVDATEEGLPVRSCSPGFRSRIGRLQLGSSLTDYVRHPDGFMRWLQVGINTANSGEEVPDRQVTLEMRQGRLAATCRLMPGSEEESLVIGAMELVFFNVRPCRGRSRGSSGSGSSSQSRGTPVVRMSL